ncbi:MAG: tRNA lysidine(34) synthetase TilS, partial [Micavibrio aeruginosavorus]
MIITEKSFEDNLKPIGDFSAEKKLALALSGGGDSMALAYLLSGFCRKNKIELHLLTVDHGLREESAKEAKTIGKWVKIWPDVIHKILKWKGDKPKTRIQEEARKARYELLSSYCTKHKIKYLFLAHHGDDQIETFLFRLAKGSGLDGLSVMPPMQDMKDIILVRPLLNATHEDMIEFC